MAPESSSDPRQPTLEVFLELGLDLMVVTDLGGSIVWGNDAIRSAIETPERPITEARIDDYIHPDDREATRDRLADLARGERVRGFRNRYRFTDGTYHTLEWFGQAVDGLVYATARDVSSEVAARDAQALAQRDRDRSERLYREIVDAQSDLIIRVDGAWRVHFANEAFLRAFDRTAEEVVGSVIDLPVHDADRAAGEAATNALHEPPHTATVTQRVRTVGGLRWISWHDRAFIGDNGAIVEIQRVGRDVTDQAEREASLRRDHRSLQAAASLAQIGRWDLDHTSDRLVWSDGVYELFGVDPDGYDPSFAGFLAAVHPDDREFVRSAYAGAIATREPYDIEHRIVRPDGEVRWLREVCEIDYAQDGSPLRSVGVVQDVTFRKTHDPLTGLANGLSIRDRLEDRLASAQQEGARIGVVSIDVDRFADLNERVGRGRSDQILILLAERIATVVGSADRVARTHGDEFIVLLPDVTSSEQARTWAERIAIELRRPIAGDGAPVALSASIGVTVFPDDEQNADTLLRHADLAMQLAKSRGRDRVVVFDPDDERRETQENVRRVRLRHALERDEFVMHVQPSASLRDGRIHGVEGLIRWNHPDEGLKPPGAFLPDLLDRPIELDVGRWILDTALETADAWIRAGVAPDGPWTFGVNIGGHQLLTPGFVEDVAAVLQRYPDVPSGTLQLEVVETAALADVDRAREVLTRCRTLGVRVALDDFGTGYSSLSYFRNLPIDTLKIDLSFVQRMLDNASDLGIVQSVIGLAQAFDRSVIAEGVETLDHAAALAALGADVAQGYVVAKPMPIADFPTWHEAWRAQRHFEDLASRLDIAVQDLPIRVAVRSHRRWIDMLRTFERSGGTSPLPPMDREACAFGAWYQGSGNAAYGSYPVFAELGRLHDHIHRVGDHLVDLVREADGANRAEGAADAAGTPDHEALLAELDATHLTLTERLESLISAN